MEEGSSTKLDNNKARGGVGGQVAVCVRAA